VILTATLHLSALPSYTTKSAGVVCVGQQGHMDPAELSRSISDLRVDHLLYIESSQ
jgi:hypothetical protein